ncbi:sigma-70 family RNA polymerase sigma factor [Tissierella sp.]|uniref:sigma-70 family RNA polymerase sigma factor n=1 Tax=Tissierella sp. TaxID=41274 RepID=UPI0028B10281|nr:sigma-70 family RNA polymerase sigma factor [Tissierella sp.]
MTDEEIAKRLRQKDMDIFDYIMENYNKLLWVVVGNILEKVGSSEDIEDCISDVYIKLLENPKIYDHKKGSLKSFLVRIGKNLAIDRYRKITRGNMIAIHEDYSEHDDLLQFILAQENRIKILEALDTLNEPDREIIIRRYYYNEKVKVISEKMSLSSKKVENKLYQGKLKLKTILIAEEGF